MPRAGEGLNSDPTQCPVTRLDFPSTQPGGMDDQPGAPWDRNQPDASWERGPDSCHIRLKERNEERHNSVVFRHENILI